MKESAFAPAMFVVFIVALYLYLSTPDLPSFSLFLRQIGF